MLYPPLQIGPVTVNPPVALAPMAGYTDSALRAVCRRFHCGLVFTEVVNAEGIVRGSHRTLHLLETDPEESPVAAHIYGRHPDTMAAAARVIEKLGRFHLIDVNCGCPVRKIVAKGCGAALMRDPLAIHDIVRAIRQAVSLPVTVKTRVGFSPDAVNISEIAHAVEEAGGAAIFIHARLAVNGHRGPADWATLARVKSERRIPVVGNGGVSNASDALAMLAQTGVDGVMIGRAAVGNPWIFAAVAARLADLPEPAHSSADHKAVILAHLDHLIALKAKERRYRRRTSLPADQAAVLHFRAHLVKYLAGFPGWGPIRRTLQTMNTHDAILAALDRLIPTPPQDDPIRSADSPLPPDSPPSSQSM